MIVAAPALAVSVPPRMPNCRTPPSPGTEALGLLVMVAFAAVLAPRKRTLLPRVVTATLVMFEFPAELVSLNVMLPGCATFDIVMMALPPVLEFLKTRLVSTRSMCALAAVLVLLNVIVPKVAGFAVKVALPAELESLNVIATPVPVVLIWALPAVLELLKASVEPVALVMIELPAVLELRKLTVPLLTMVAVLAELVSWKLSVAAAALVML